MSLPTMSSPRMIWKVKNNNDSRTYTSCRITPIAKGSSGGPLRLEITTERRKSCIAKANTSCRITPIAKGSSGGPLRFEITTETRKSCIAKANTSCRITPIAKGSSGGSLRFEITTERRKSCIAKASTSVEASKHYRPHIMVNGCTGQTGGVVLEAAIRDGFRHVPVALGHSAKIVNVGGIRIEVHGPSHQRENILSSIFHEYPDLIVVDYTVPNSMNENAALYCKVGVPFVMGTTGGDKKLLYETVADSKTYAVISPQMGKQLVAFLAGIRHMSEQFPGVLSGYTLQVTESHQASKKDTSGTGQVLVSNFLKLGASHKPEQDFTQIRDPKIQAEKLGVPEEHIDGHAFHKYQLRSPDGTVYFEFQHTIYGRSTYAEGTLDAILFLAKMVKLKDDKRIYDVIDVLKEGNMR